MPGNVEIAITNNGWGGDLIIDATGDIVLVADQPNNPAATVQRIYRLLMTNPRIFDPGLNVPASIPDDLFAPNYGAGLRILTGTMITAQIVPEIEASILNALQTDPTVVSNPSPIVIVQNVGSNVLQINVTAYAVNGEVIAVPSFSLAFAGAS